MKDIVNALHDAGLISDKKYNLQLKTVQLVHERRRIVTNMRAHVIPETKDNKVKISKLSAKIRKFNKIMEGMG